MKKIFIIISVLTIISVALYFVVKNGQENIVAPELTRTVMCPSPWNEKWASPQDTEIKNPRAVFYVSSSAGNDNNSGTSTNSPWKTLEKVNTEKLSPGDIILLKRGDAWKEKLSPPTSGSVQAPITFGAYGGNGPRPILHKQESIVVISNKNYITLNNLDIQDCTYCIQILGSDSIILEYLSAGLNADGSVIDIDRGSDRGIVQYSKIDGGTEHRTERDMIRLMDGNNWEIHHNLIANFGHDGINLFGRIPRVHDIEAHVTKNDIHHNEFFNKLDYGRAFETQGNGPGYASFNKFHNNYIYNVQVSIQLQGDHNEVYRNVITDVRKSPQHSDDGVFQAAGISMQDYIYSSNNKVYENIIAHTDGPGIVVGSRESGNEIRNNFIYSAGEHRGSARSLYDIGLYIVEKTLKLGETPGAQVYKENHIYSPDTENTIIYRGLHYENPSPITVGKFNSHNDQNGDSIIKNSGQKFSLSNDCKVLIGK